MSEINKNMSFKSGYVGKDTMRDYAQKCLNMGKDKGKREKYAQGGVGKERKDQSTRGPMKGKSTKGIYGE